MSIDRSNPRNPTYDVDAQFIDRWSPRSYVTEELPEALVKALFEAARWAPSCMNVQPWLFWMARTAESRRKFLESLVERNQSWAKSAPLLIYIGARKVFETGGKPNRHAGFDTGAAWMSLALQARHLGLHAHGMAGFDLPAAHTLTKTTPETVEIFAAVAVGKRAAPESLPEALRAREIPSGRKEIQEFVVELE
jgi:nitroreductase